LNIQERVYKFITLTNWVLLAVISSIGFIFTPPEFALGIFCGGIIVSINFHLLSRTIKKKLLVSGKPSFASVLAKYYIRFSISGIILFILVVKNIAHPIGLVIGLSIVVVSITLAGVIEAKKLICKETV
jgi:hypothetical protein